MSLGEFFVRLCRFRGARRLRAGFNAVKQQLSVEQLEDRMVLSTASLVAAYNFDQGSGSTLTDVSGNGNNGTISNATWVTGKNGDALKFTGAANSMVTIADVPSLDLTNGMTLEAWINPSTLNSLDNGWSAAVAKDNQVNSSTDVDYALYAAQGTGTGPSAHILQGGSDDGTTGGSKLPLGKWSFLCATYDGSACGCTSTARRSPAAASPEESTSMGILCGSAATGPARCSPA